MSRCVLFSTPMSAKIDGDRGDPFGRPDQGDPAGRRFVQTHLGIPAVHVHEDFGGARRHQSPRRRGPGAGTGTRAAGLGDAGTALVDAHRHGVRLRAWLDDLDVDLRDDRSDGDEVDHGDVLDADDGVRIADAEVADRAVRVGADAVPIGRLVDLGDLTHVDRGLDPRRGGPFLRRADRHQTRAGIGEDAQLAGPAEPAGQRLREAADAVAAHLGARPVGVVQHHPGIEPVG